MTDTRASQGTGGNLFVLTLAAVAAIGGFLFGFDSGVINGTVEALSNAFDTTTAQTGFSVSSILIGCAAGAFFAGNLADRFGRKPIMVITAIVFLISALGTGAAPEVISFNAFRLLGGLAVGSASVLAPAYISEISPPAVRGRLASLQQLAIVVGLFCAALSNYLIALASGGAEKSWLADIAAWRWMFWVEVIPSAAFFIGALLIPESPRYLVSRGRTEEAEHIFNRAGGDGATLVSEVQQSLVGTTRARAADLFASGSWNLRGIVWVAIGLSVFQQLVGINVIFYYSAVLWQAVGFAESAALLTSMITNVTNIVATLTALLLIDRLGRRPLLLLGSLGMVLTLATLVIFFSQASVDSEGKLQLVGASRIGALAAVNLYIISFGVSWGPVVWVMLGEMFPNRIRGAGLALAAMMQWLANFIVSVSFPSLLKAFGPGGAYAVYTVAAALSLLFVWRFVRETKGKSLEQMEG